MSLLKKVLRGIVALFVDDEFLAFATLIVVGVAALIIKTSAADVATAGVTLLGGSIGVLMLGVWRTARSHRRKSFG